MTELAKAYVHIVPTTRNLGANLKKEMSGDLSKSGDDAGKTFGGKMVDTIKRLVVAAGIGKVIGDAINIGSELQQNLGGTEAVWQDYADTIKDTATSAYATMGMSASDYMATANKIGALMQGSGIDQSQAVDMTAAAMQRAADVASVMGISTETAMEAIAGAAKNNLTMMDNLGVAMNATTLEAYAQSKGMTDFAYATASNAEKTSLAMQMFMEQTEQYAGNFERESSETISGSIGALKSAWTDLLGNLALGEKVDLSPLIKTITAAASNIIPAISNIIVQLPNQLVTLVSNLAPLLTQQGMNLLINLMNGFAGSLPTMLPMITQTLITIVQTIIATLPEFLNSGAAMVGGLVEGFMASIDLLIECVPTLILALVDALSENLPTIIEGGVTLLTSIIQDLPRIIQGITAAIPALVTGICDGIIGNIGLIVNAGIQLFFALLQALPEILRQLVPLIGELVKGMAQALMSFYKVIVEAGKNLILGLKDGIKNAANKIYDAVRNVCSNISKKIKSFFGIASPSKLFAEYGGYLMQGFANGIDKNEGLVTDSIGAVGEDVANSMRYDLGSTASLSMRGYESGNSSMLKNISEVISGGDKEIVLKLDGKTLARATYRYNKQVSNEHGLSLVNA